MELGLIVFVFGVIGIEFLVGLVGNILDRRANDCAITFRFQYFLFLMALYSWHFDISLSHCIGLL